MTVALSTSSVLKYSGNDSTNTFSVTFNTYQNSDINVFIETSSTGVLTELTETTHYTLSNVGIPGSNASVTLINAGESYFGSGGFLDTGYRVIIEFDDSAYQITNLQNLGRFSSANFGLAVDRATMFIKKVFSKASRALLISYKDEDAGFDPSLPADLSGNAGTIIGVNATGDGLQIYSPTVAGVTDGDVNGPVSSTDNAIARFDAATGKVIQNSTAIISDAGHLSTATIDALTNFQIASGLQMTSIKDEDDMASDSVNALATQQSIKAYADAVQVAATAKRETVFYTGFTSRSGFKVKLKTEAQDTSNALLSVDNTTYTKITALAACTLIGNAGGQSSGGSATLYLRIWNSSDVLQVNTKAVTHGAANNNTLGINYELAVGDYITFDSDSNLTDNTDCTFSVSAIGYVG